MKEKEEEEMFGILYQAQFKMKEDRGDGERERRKKSKKGKVNFSQVRKILKFKSVFVILLTTF